MTDYMPGLEGRRSRLEAYASQLRELGEQPYATIPDLAFLHDLERAIQSEVDRMIIELRESGYSFATIAKWADEENPEPWLELGPAEPARVGG